MHYAAANGNIQALKMLLAKNADVNVKNTAAETPLMKACQFIELDAIQFLLGIDGIDVLAQDTVRVFWLTIRTAKEHSTS
jgi:ankyrin repeat protein